MNRVYKRWVIPVYATLATVVIAVWATLLWAQVFVGTDVISDDMIKDVTIVLAVVWLPISLVLMISGLLDMWKNRPQ